MIACLMSSAKISPSSAVCRCDNDCLHLGLMRLLQSSLHFAFPCKVLLSIFIFVMFLFTVSLNRSLGPSWFHYLSWCWEYRICWCRRLWSILSRWPSHCRFFFIRMNFRDDSPALFSTSSLLILSFQEIPWLILNVSKWSGYSRACFSTLHCGLQRIGLLPSSGQVRYLLPENHENQYNLSHESNGQRLNWPPGPRAWWVRQDTSTLVKGLWWAMPVSVK